VTAAKLRRACLLLPGASEDFPFGEEVSVFRVAGKLFALGRLRAEPLELTLKCEPELAELHRAAWPAVRPGYHMNKRHWNTVTLDGSVPEPVVVAMIEDAYDLVVAALPRARREALGVA